MQGSGSWVLTLESLPTTNIKLVWYAKGCFPKEADFEVTREHSPPRGEPGTYRRPADEEGPVLRGSIP